MSLIDVVISGIGGRFPKSRNIKEFNDNLLTGESLLQPIDRWPAGKLDTPELAGLTDGVDRFDYTFFGYHFDLAKRAAPEIRISMETAFEAVIDAGVSPTTIRGSNAQVFTGLLQSEADCYFDEWIDNKRGGYVVQGRTRSMCPNRISSLFNLCGCSSAYDASGGWLGFGLAFARKAIQNGECDTVFVNGSSAILMLEITKQKQNMGLLSPDSSCRPFAIDANGLPRGEAQVTFLIQRADIAKRSYGSIVLAEAASLLTLPDWLLALNPDHFQNFLTSLYRDSGLDPNKVKLLEADGLGIKNMVEVELNVLDKVLNEKRPANSPLYVGTVKSITGDTDGSAGHTALTKLILAMETGIISPTLNCGNLNPNLRGITEGRLKVVTGPTEWDVTPDTHVAVSSLTTTGLVSHVVLRAHGKTKDTHVENDYPLPYLILMSGRSENNVRDSLSTVAFSTFDPEYLRLTQEVFGMTIDNLFWRGYGFHDEDENFVIQLENRRPVWFVYSGMGSQWPTMGKDLRLIPIIEETFQRLHKILEPKGIDLLYILTTSESDVFDNILNCFVGIASVQIALTNLLRQLGIVPDGLIGHSVGELGCSYADGCLTEEQTILASYERGMATLKAELISGLMAAVGLGYKEAKDLLPPDVCVACRNSEESCTISGPTESVKKVIASFKKQGIFVRGVNVANIAYHSPYIQPAAPFLFESLRKIIPSPKLRSSKWICTSAPQEKWDTDEVRYCSAEYHTNNLLGAVLFEEGSAHIPENALVIEIAPHGLLQAILIRSLGNDVAHVSLTRRGAQSPSKFLLQAIGKLFLEGQSVKIWHLYPDVEMPVSRNTPSLAPLVKWEHSEIFDPPQAQYTVAEQFSKCELNDLCPSIEIAKSKCLPASYVLVQIYHRLAELIGAKINTLRVIMEDVCFYDLIRFEEKEIAEVNVSVLPKTGTFAATKNDKLVVKGTIRAVGEIGYESKKLPYLGGHVEFSLSSDDVYSELKSRGVIVPNKLKTIEEVDVRPHDWIARIPFEWDHACLINSFILLFQLGSENVNRKPASVSRIQQLIIDPSLEDIADNEARLHLATGTLVYPGFSMSGVEFQTVDTTADSGPVTLRFVPFGLSGLEDEAHFLSSVLQLNSEKRWQKSSFFKICDIDGEFTSITDKIHDLLQSNFIATTAPKDADLIVCGLSSISGVASTLASSNNTLLTRCSRNERNSLKDTLREFGLDIIAESDAKGSTKPLIAICSLIPRIQPSDCEIIKMKPDETLPVTLKNTKHRFTIFVWENDTFHSTEKMLSDAKFTGREEKIRIIVVMTPNAPSFSMSNPLFADQLRLNVPLNIYLDGKWGNYRLLPNPESSQFAQDGHKNLVIQPEIVLKDRESNIVKLDLASIKIYDGLALKRRFQSSKEAIVYCAKSSASASIIGVATWEDESNILVPDPALFWTVTEEWCCDSAAPVLFSYVMAYYILFEIAQLRMKKSILITCPLTSFGQAVIRVANSLSCEIVTLVPSMQEKQQIKYLFPKLNANIIVSSSDSFSCILKKEYPEGVHIIVSDLTGSKLRACTDCLHEFGTIVQVDENAMLTSDYIGTYFFLKAAVLYGVTQHILLNASSEVKRKVQQWVDQGLENGVVVPEIQKSSCSMNGSVVNGARKPRESFIYDRINGHHEKEYNTIDWLSKTAQKRRNSAVIIGGSKAQWVRLSYSLALKGCKIVALIQENPSPSLVIRHSKILHREFDMELRDLTNIHSGADLIKSNLGNLRSIFVFGNNSLAEEVVRELDLKGQKDVRILLFSKNSVHFVRKCERWAQNGLKVRAALGVEDEPICGAILDWLLSPSAATVSVLNLQAFVGSNVDSTSLNECGMLPTSDSELRTLGAAIRKQNSPIFREIATRGMNSRRKGDVNPLFFIKGIHGNATKELETLAAGLLAPLVEVTLHAECGSLETTAAAVAQGILRIQREGPYNLAGDTIRSDVVIKVARILEDKGYASVLFLMNEQIASLRESLNTLEKFDRLGETLLRTALSDCIGLQSWNNLLIGNMEWSKQVQVAVSKIPSLNEERKDDVEAALHHVYASVQHILESREEAILDHGIVHLLRTGDEYRESKLTDRCLQYSIPSTKLKRKELADIFSPNLATPVLQLQFDKTREDK